MHNAVVPAEGRQLLSVIVPCYNEEAVIGETIRRLDAFCAEMDNFDVELIFIDDGSRDRTRDLLRQYAAANPRIKLIGFANIVLCIKNV